MGHSQPVILSILRLAQTWNFAQRGALGRFWAGRWSRDASYASRGPTRTCAQARRSLKPSIWVVRNQRNQLGATAADAGKSARFTAHGAGSCRIHAWTIPRPQDHLVPSLTASGASGHIWLLYASRKGQDRPTAQTVQADLGVATP